jgi:hypothetical protein
MKGHVIVVSMILLCGPVQAQSSGDAQAVLIGPWKIEASFTKGQILDRCMMSRTIDNGIETRFSRDEGGTSLTLTSQRWKLENGKSYPVEFVAGRATWKADVAASADAVRIPLTDVRFNKALRNVNRMEVRAAGSTIRIPLDKSSAALARLDRCYETNRNAIETNPFVKPKP